MPKYQVQIHLEGGASAVAEHDDTSSATIDRSLDAAYQGAGPFLQFSTITGGNRDGLIQVIKTKVLGWSIQEMP